MAIKIKKETSYDYNKHAKILVDEYLEKINSKGKDKYDVVENEIERIANELRENNGLLTSRIEIKKI